MTDRPKIFFIGPQVHQLETVRILVDKGVEIPLLCVDETRNPEAFASAAPGSVLYLNHEAKSGAIPRTLDLTPPPVGADTLERLLPFESEALLMMDRENVRNWPLSEVRRAYLRIVGTWGALLDRLTPDLVVFHDSPCRGYDFVLYNLARLRGIRTLFFDMTNLDDTVAVRSELGEHVLADPARSDEHAVAVHDDGSIDGNYVERAGPAFHAMDRVRDVTRSATTARALIGRDLLLPFRRRRHAHYGLVGEDPTTLERRLRRFAQHVQNRALFRTYERLSSAIAQDETYVYYPLQFQPERSTLPQAWPLTEQLNNIAMASRYLPPGWRIYVKEHPGQFLRPAWAGKARSRRYYEDLAGLPGVRIVAIDADGRELVRRARAVLTGTGTPGWEALRVGVPAIVFGDAWYVRCPGVVRVRTLHECERALADVARGAVAVDPAEVLRFAHAVARSGTIRAIFAEALVPYSRLTAGESAAAYAAAILSALE